MPQLTAYRTLPGHGASRKKPESGRFPELRRWIREFEKTKAVRMHRGEYHKGKSCTEKESLRNP